MTLVDKNYSISFVKIPLFIFTNLSLVEYVV
jgi:hypothetical protein